MVKEANFVNEISDRLHHQHKFILHRVIFLLVQVGSVVGVHVTDRDGGKPQELVWFEIHVVLCGGRHREVRVETF